MLPRVGGVPVQVAAAGLFGTDCPLLCDAVDRCGVGTHHALDGARFAEELRAGLRAEWADPVRWLLGDPATEDVRPHQQLWLEPQRSATPLAAAPSRPLEPVLDPYALAHTGFAPAPCPAVRGPRGAAAALSTTPPSQADVAAELRALDLGLNLRRTPPGFPAAVDFGPLPPEPGDALPETVSFPSHASTAAPVAQAPVKDIAVTSLFAAPVVPPDGEEAAPAAAAADGAAPHAALDEALRTLPPPDSERALRQRQDVRATLPEGAPTDEYPWAVTRPTDVTDFAALVPHPALEYSFELDNFQKQAVLQMERGNFVFVAAHTSAGKTVVAEYAIALCRKHMTRAIYTSPIKTLSNQKFREFRQRFGDAGLLTGDAQVNPGASVLIMTTEILRSMLYRDVSLVQDVEWVIFDEVHYVNDAERGYVWEEVIVMLPPHVKMVMLSATVPNSTEFADWIGRTKQRKVYVISTLKRPVPLRYYVFYEHAQHEVVVDGKFQLEAYQQLVAKQQEKEKKSPHLQHRALPAKLKAERREWVQLVLHLKAQSLLPAVGFAFSRKRCEELCAALVNVDFNSKLEKSRVTTLVDRCLKPLKEEDRELPQIRRVRATALCGVGVHHAGLLPLLKELVELLFQEGLIKVLFATETFAMGVNMPTRTVVFASLRKHDGQEFRSLHTGEFIQMAGRAGRRGLDVAGTVLIAGFGETGLPEAADLQLLLTGRARQLQSRFRLTYNMILNLLRLDHFRVEDMLRSSFSEARAARLAPLQRKTLLDAQARLQALPAVQCLKGEPDIEEYHRLALALRAADRTVHRSLLASPSALRQLSLGRVVVVRTDKYGPTLGFIVKPQATPSKPRLPLPPGVGAPAPAPALPDPGKWFQVVLLRLSRPGDPLVPTASGLPPFPRDAFALRPLGEAADVPLFDILAVCRKKLPMLVAEDKGSRGKQPAGATPPWPVLLGMAGQLLTLWETSPTEGPEVLHPIRDLELATLDAVDAQTERDSLLACLRTHKCATCPNLRPNWEAAVARHEARLQVAAAEDSLSDKNLSLVPEFEVKLRVLRRFGYINDEQDLELLGRVCGGLHSGHEVLLAELVLRGLLTPLTPEECAALLSALVCQEKSPGLPRLSDDLEALRTTLLALAADVGAALAECGDADGAALPETALNFALMHVAFAWAAGSSMLELCSLTDVMEGSLVRMLTRLDQAVRDVKTAATLLGDLPLADKMGRTSDLLRRDIVFAGSLYLTL